MPISGERGQKICGAGVVPAHAGRRRQVQHRMSHAGNFAQASRYVEIAKHGRNTLQTQGREVLRSPVQAQQPVMRL